MDVYKIGVSWRIYVIVGNDELIDVVCFGNVFYICCIL